MGYHEAPRAAARIYYDLYVILDIFSRYVGGWTVAARESAEIAGQLIADHRPAWPARQSARRPRYLDDLYTGRAAAGRSRRDPLPLAPTRVECNPYSEAQFKTLKYAPVFPDQLGSLADARGFCWAFFGYYNHEHRHSATAHPNPPSCPKPPGSTNPAGRPSCRPARPQLSH